MDTAYSTSGFTVPCSNCLLQAVACPCSSTRGSWQICYEAARAPHVEKMSAAHSSPLDSRSTIRHSLRVSERVASSIVESLARLEALQKAQRERDEYKKLYTHLREENERLKRGLLGKKAEKLPQNDAQLSLAILGLMLGGGEEPTPPPADEEATRVIPEHTRKVPKRRGPSDDWPRIYIELIPPEVEREGLDAFDIIGQRSEE